MMADGTPQIVVVDVGARWGAAKHWAALGDRVQVFGFDPDASECDRLNALAPPNVRYVPVALGSSDRVSPLHITREPACSSIYPPLPLQALPQLVCTELDHVEKIRLQRLDDWRVENAVGAVSCLKLDTQGSELDVLQGATATLSDVVLVDAEVEFNPIYDGQPLFGDVDRFMRAQGFVLWRLSEQAHYSSDPGSVSARSAPETMYFDSRPVTVDRGGGQLYWGHAVFVPAALLPTSPKQATPDMVERAVVVANAYGLVDLAMEVARKGNAGRDAR